LENQVIKTVQSVEEEGEGEEACELKYFIL
jgi:hypothetical protein